jgi:hypothetical protein
VISEAEVRYFWKDMSRELQRIAPDQKMNPAEAFVAERFDAFGVSELAITKAQFLAARGPHVATFVKLLTHIAVMGERRVSERYSRRWSHFKLNLPMSRSSL